MSSYFLVPIIYLFFIFYSSNASELHKMFRVKKGVFLL